MATLIPSLNSCLPKMTSGEKRLARRLESHLEDDYSCWFDIPLGGRQKYSDFIVLHPARGLLLLEVKDWKLDTIRSVDRASVELLTSSGIKRVGNPIEQVRQCAYQLVNRLQADHQLVHPGGRYKGNLIFPYGFGVVLSNITRKQFERAQLGEVLPTNQTLCSDEMTESTDLEVFQSKLWGMFNVVFQRKLSLPQLDRIRWHIFPEVRIGTEEFVFESPPQGETDKSVAELLPDVVKVMDMQQEKLARSLGSGHRVIHGVAGSGKTMILGYRSLYLAEVLSKPILVVCFNITLAARLRSMLASRGVGDKVQVYHFHDWCASQMRAYNLPRPQHGDSYAADLVNSVIRAVDRGQIPRGQYGALLIDEGHDFEADWLRMVVQMVDPKEGSLLLLYDDAQSIYRSKKPLDFSLSSVGIQARGRTTVLRINYRNTDEILAFAYRFASNYLSPSASDEDHVPLVEPEAAGRSGPQPYFRLLQAESDEHRYVSRFLRAMNEKRCQPWSDMLVTCVTKRLADRICAALSAEGVPHSRVIDQQEKKSLDMSADTVKVMTMHSSKGLEFPLVVIPGVGYLPRDNIEQEAEARLLYVAMTRATEKLLLTASRRSEFVKLLEAPVLTGHIGDTLVPST
ncbi:3'-5' exonuclease [Pseudohaliea sp.]|uniref:3'-5' exonuclease n=1 Tax=Pseudohaliea sp. TaxID=2740289 RepID=UPI0032EF10DE